MDEQDEIETGRQTLIEGNAPVTEPYSEPEMVPITEPASDVAALEARREEIEEEIAEVESIEAPDPASSVAIEQEEVLAALDDELEEVEEAITVAAQEEAEDEGMKIEAEEIEGVCERCGKPMIHGVVVVFATGDRAALGRDCFNHLRHGKQPTTVQTLIFSPNYFSQPAAIEWAKSHGFRYSKVDVVKARGGRNVRSFRLRQIDPSKFKSGSFRTIQIAPGIEAVIGHLRKQSHKNHLRTLNRVQFDASGMDPAKAEAILRRQHRCSWQTEADGFRSYYCGKKLRAGHHYCAEHERDEKDLYGNRAHWRELYDITFEEGGRRRSWSRWSKSQHDAKEDAKHVLDREFPAGGWKIISVRKHSDARVGDSVDSNHASGGWTYDVYWNVVLGANRNAGDVVREFDLNPRDYRGLDEWLGVAEAEAWIAGGGGGNMPKSWTGFHQRALKELSGVR